ncbi:hypothetical protein GGQ68_003020 [Sagittula marina]|uniref:DUF6314 domain-containing protein n=1 Tax=Sagittula marina TaxID=943940 RepID=A0A7W6DPR2_9RHOB|nr:DUF6314 family protein [Sagittula marina]MBB3986677.1 hypothetical protein [Sagittula marina]
MTRNLTDFLGRWQIAREIAHSDGTQARFAGTAVWTLGESGADYVETGVLEMGTARFNAERRYRWTDALEVYFDDGRFFHAVPQSGGRASHWCDPDQYDVTYEFADWPRWRAVWRVRGPRKDYTMISCYTPDAG